MVRHVPPAHQFPRLSLSHTHDIVLQGASKGVQAVSAKDAIPYMQGSEQTQECGLGTDARDISHQTHVGISRVARAKTMNEIIGRPSGGQVGGPRSGHMQVGWDGNVKE